MDIDDFFKVATQADFAALERKDYFSARCNELSEDLPPAEAEPKVKELLALVAKRNDSLLEPALLRAIQERAKSFTLESLKSSLDQTRHQTSSPLKTGSDFLPDLYAKALLENRHVIFWHNAFYLYDAGCYRPWHEWLVKRVIQELGKGELRGGQIRDAIHSLKIMTYVVDDAVNKPGIINIKNGWLDLNQKQPTLQPHTPGLLSTIQLPVSYNPTATCSRFIEFLRRAVPDKSVRALLQELAGYTLVADNSHHNSASSCSASRDRLNRPSPISFAV